MNKHSNDALLLYASAAHPCPYLPDREAVSAFVDPQLEMTSELYGLLLDLGFRRSGEQVYRPHCTGCEQCLPVRIAAKDFTSNRNQRRTIKLHANTVVKEKKAIFDPIHLDLYNKYMSNRHSDSDMGNASQESYLSFLTSRWCETRFFEFYRYQQLFAVAVVDVVPQGLSAVYTFFDPEFDSLSPGRYAILWLLQETLKRGQQWLYLGYWIADCDKMTYKSNYRPLELLLDHKWRAFPRNKTLPY